MTNSAHSEIEAGDRFAFGANWKEFAGSIREDRIDASVSALSKILQTGSLTGQSFLDIGCGSGLSSLAAARMGAAVRAFDFDRNSVETTKSVFARHMSDADADVTLGSALDVTFLKTLGTYDVVYSWGVLHHTGNMWRGIELSLERVKPGGKLALAIYNDQGGASRRWLLVKRIYNRLPALLRPVYAAVFGLYFEMRTVLIKILRFQNPLPFKDWRARNRDRGMSVWRDLIDWVGGYPFEVAKPEEIFDFCRDRGFELRYMRTCGGGMACNEFLFEKTE